jgi:hypothetical protein
MTGRSSRSKAKEMKVTHSNNDQSYDQSLGGSNSNSGDTAQLIPSQLQSGIPSLINFNDNNNTNNNNNANLNMVNDPGTATNSMSMSMSMSPTSGVCATNVSATNVSASTLLTLKDPSTVTDSYSTSPVTTSASAAPTHTHTHQSIVYDNYDDNTIFTEMPASVKNALFAGSHYR